jgi:hypothetical protein
MQKLTSNMEELRKAIFRQELGSVTRLKGLEWRFEVEVASRGYKNDFQPNVLLNLRIEEGERVVNNFVNCDFANLKNLQSQLASAMRLHRSARFRTARNSSI